jgi:GT2 family glycosyltransferase
MRLTISIVTYRSDPSLFIGTLHFLTQAVEYAKLRFPALRCELYILENDYLEQRNFKQAENFLKSGNDTFFDDVVVKSVGDNLGYGRGHNVAFNDSISDYHLVLNPDVSLGREAIYEGLSYLSEQPNVAIVSPHSSDGDGVPLFLCKRYPAIFDLLLRGFAPKWLKEYFHQRLGHYEMHELSGVSEPVTGINIVSGCCMLIRTEVYARVGGFDKSFFLYFEDFDLSLRIHEVGEVVYLPAMKIIHYGGQAARKGLLHISLFAASAWKFYRRHGWRWL